VEVGELRVEHVADEAVSAVGRKQGGADAPGIFRFPASFYIT